MHDERFTIPYGKNTYCGPAALAYILRESPDVAAARLRDVSGRRSIRGTHRQHMLSALERANVFAVPAMPPTRLNPRLGQYLRHLGHPHSPIRGEYLIVVTGHYIVVHDGLYFDNRCHLGKPLDRCPYLLKRVRAAWQID
jgi:hypothetical protein